MLDSIALSPAQQAAYDEVTEALEAGSIAVLRARTGCGRSTVLARLHEALGGKVIGLAQFLEAADNRHPLALEESLFQVVWDELAENEHVLVDDLHVATAVMAGCHFYPRSGLLDSPLTVLASYAASAGKKLILATGRRPAGPILERAYVCSMDSFSPADYRHLCQAFLADGLARRLDFDKVYRFAPKLNAHRLKGACHWFNCRGQFDTEAFIDYLRSRHLASNVELGEVTDVELSDLKGVDDVIEQLEANIVLPLENDELASELALQPKRGVLLVGPPGTGKTTIGRALAHRLKSKFFLIDGTIISGTRNFYESIQRVFEAAKENAPSVLFLDDSDVIFESGQEHGLYRYLLTMLDGLESKSAGRVCVMMTAMDVGNLPPALVRSGRIELWLEMRLPDEPARLAIIEPLAAGLPHVLRDLDAVRLAAETEGFTGADLKRTVEDGKALYAFDRSNGRQLLPITDYFLSAATLVAKSRQQYAAAEARARASRPVRPPWFHVGFPGYLADDE
jgi:energy-coupling factor transporter ATP-binding protein EcfA2